jgi:hypothetical protein
MATFKDECNNTISKVQDLLIQNPEWENRYDLYAKQITANAKDILDMKQKFREWKPLFVYMNVSSAKSHLTFSLRYLGQDVARLKVDQNNIPVISTVGFDIKNHRDFGCNIVLNDCAWRSADAKKFREHFSHNVARTKNSSKGNDEHRIESLLLTEFSKVSKLNKEVSKIQPVKFCGIARFQMPSPLSASNKKAVKYAGTYGGGIDIMTRIGKGRGVKLCIMEVKDENTTKEPPTQAVLQGLAYATFMRELLRSESGALWWKIFGFTGQLPKKLDLYVASVMPSIGNDDHSFANLKFKIGYDNLILGALYFKESKNHITAIDNYLKPCL